MSTFKIENLESCLAMWEDYNLMATAYEKVYQIARENSERGIGKGTPPLPSLVGSEITQVGNLGRPILGYQNLRKELENSKTEIDYQKYLPRIPKDLRELFDDKELFVLARGRCHPFVSFPMFLSQWIRSKRVIAINKKVKIETREIIGINNSFDKLPYDQFLLYLATPFTLNLQGKKVIETSQVVVFKQDHLIFMLLIPNISIADDILLTLEERNDIRRFLAMDRKKSNEWMKNPPMRWREFNPVILTLSDQGYMVSVSNDGKSIFAPLDTTIQGKTSEFKSLIDFIKFFNGFIYTLANATPEEEIFQEIVIARNLDKITENSGSSDEKGDTENLAWNEVLNDFVQHLKVKNVGGEVKYIKSNGFEVSPHLRRGHLHTFHTKNGPVLKWVNNLIVRKDKLNNEVIKGGVLKLND